MNKVISSILVILSLLAGVLLLFSSLLISEKGLKYLLNYNQTSNVDFILTDSYWHPYKPSIEIESLSLTEIKEDNNFLKVNGLKIEFNLFSLFQSNLIETFYAEDLNLFFHSTSNKEEISLTDLWIYVSSIKNLKIKEFSLTDTSDYSNTLKGDLSLISSKSGESKLKVFAQNATGGNLDFRMNSIVGSKSLKDYKGFLNTSNFILNQEITNRLCLGCPSGTLDSNIWFTLIDLKLVKFLGDLNFRLHSSLDLIHSIKANIELENTAKNIFKISTFLNEAPTNSPPVIFASFENKELFFFIPKIELGEDKFINKYQHLLDFPQDLFLKGLVSNIIINIGDFLLFKADFEDLSIESNNFSISGLKGKLQYLPDLTKLTVDTPSLEIDLGALFDSPLIFNDLSSELHLSLIDEKVSISNSTFQGTHKKTSIKGEVNLFASPFDDAGDLSLKITSNELDYIDALNLFPNLTYTQLTKSWLQKSISCGSLQGFSFIYRGPIDNEYNDSSSSFQSKGLLNNSCLKVNDVEINKINLVGKIDNSSFLGEILDGDLYGSQIKGTVKTYKDDINYKLELKGDSEGPFTTILHLSNLNKIFNTELDESGKHETNFYFISPLVSNLDLLGKNSDLQLITKIKDANFRNRNTSLNFSNFYSSLEYDSSSGVKDGYATISINNIPVKFDIKKAKKGDIFNTQLIAEENFQAKNIFSEFDKKNDIRGSSRFKIKLTLPSFIKEQPLIDPEIKVLSNLKGISINLPDPLKKLEDSAVDFNLIFTPYLNKPPLLSFKYGDLFRGKFRFQNNLAEGFVIAGKEKQSISISNKRILLVGELQKLDLGSLFSYGLFEGKGSGNFFIKDLLVQETNFSKLSLSKTRFSSFKTKAGVEYKFINDDLSGILLVPEEDDKNLFFKFDFIKIKQTSVDSKGAFLSLYNSIEDEFDFSSEAIFINDKDYGNWEFTIIPDTNQFTLNNIKGVYGKWGLKDTSEGISFLNISKNPIGWTTRLKTNIYSGSPEKAMLQIGIKPNFELDTISLDTDLTWNDLPWLLEYNSIQGEITTNLEGLIIENSGDLETPNNLLRLVNIFNITDSFEKVTNLDFRKLYKRGFSADSVTGKFRISDKSLQIKKPILLKSGSSEFSWTGDISRDKNGNLDLLNLEVIMTLPLREYLPAYALVLGGPITAGVVYIAGKAFEKNLDKISSGKWKIKGDISNPKTDFDGWFEESNDLRN